MNGSYFEWPQSRPGRHRKCSMKQRKSPSGWRGFWNQNPIPELFLGIGFRCAARLGAIRTTFFCIFLDRTSSASRISGTLFTCFFGGARRTCCFFAFGFLGFAPAGVACQSGRTRYKQGDCRNPHHSLHCWISYFNLPTVYQ